MTVSICWVKNKTPSMRCFSNGRGQGQRQVRPGSDEGTPRQARAAPKKQRRGRHLPECWQLLTRWPRTQASHAYFSPSIIILAGGLLKLIVEA